MYGTIKRSLSWKKVKKEILKKFPGVVHMTAKTLYDYLKEADRNDYLIIDVRAKEEYAVSHIKDALWMTDLKQIDALLKQKPQIKKVILYCSVGYRSSDMALRLMKQGHYQVYNLDGSIFEWANQGYPVYKGKSRVYTVHPFNTTWGSLLHKRYHSDL